MQSNDRIVESIEDMLDEHHSGAVDGLERSSLLFSSEVEGGRARRQTRYESIP